MCERAHEALRTVFNDLPSWGKAGVVAGVGLALYLPYKYVTSLPRKSPYKEDYEPGVVYLYQFPRCKNVPNISTYCLKLETWLRMADIPYEIVNIPLNIRSKEGTLPFIEFNGKEHYDSSFIIRDLTELLGRTGMDEHLTEEQRAVSRAFEKLTELSLSSSHKTIQLDHIKEIVSMIPPEAFGVFYPVVSWLTVYTMGTKMSNLISSTGYGKHSPAERVQIGCDDLKAISSYLGSKHYFTGFKPTKIDACLFGFLAFIIYAPYENAHLDFIRRECPNLVEYVERIKSRFWPDWADCTSKFSTDSHWKKKGHHVGSPKQNSPKISITAHQKS